MLINLRNALMAGKRLPYDAEVEFLESTGTQWIDTGLNYFADFEIGVKLRGNVPNKVLGVFSNMCMERRSATNPNWQLHVGSRAFISTASIVDFHTMSWKGGVFAADGVTVDTVSNPFASGTMTLFGAGAQYFPSMIYACKLWDANGVLVRDLIPVRKGTVGYLYDRVSGKLFGNAGTGDFVLGQDVVPVEYIESHGTEWINSGINIDTGTDTVQGDVLFLPDTGSGYKYYFGTYGTPIGESASTYYALAKVANATNIIAYIPSTASSGYSTPSMGSVGESWHTVQMGPSGLYFDGVDKTGSIVQRTVAFGAPFALFAGVYANDGRPRNYCKARLRHLQISRNNTLVRSFRPVRVGTEGAMMDVLTRRIYRNAGTGAFTYGNDLKYPIPAS